MSTHFRVKSGELPNFIEVYKIHRPNLCKPDKNIVS